MLDWLEVIYRLGAATLVGVGAVTALAYRATIDVPARFRNSKAVGAVLGLTPAQQKKPRFVLLMRQARSAVS